LARAHAALLGLAGRRGVAQRAVAAEAFALVVREWDFARMGDGWGRVEAALLKQLKDASLEVRKPARAAVASSSGCAYREFPFHPERTLCAQDSLRIAGFDRSFDLGGLNP